jgi:LAGLIDADG endonuclease
MFRISQDKIDESLLEHISSFLGCGKVFRNKTGIIPRDFTFGVYSMSDLNTIIIPFFNKYKLCTSKDVDFHYFCDIVNIFNKKGYKKR